MQEQSNEAGRHSNEEPRRFGRKKKIAAMTVATMTIAGAAFAYWTTGGTGTGSADTGTTAAIVVNQTSTVANLDPDEVAQPLSGTFTNTTNDGPVYVTDLNAVVTAVNDADGALLAGCTAADYTIAGTGAVGKEIPNGTSVETWGNLTIAFDNDPARNQDLCKNAQVVITYTAS